MTGTSGICPGCHRRYGGAPDKCPSCGFGLAERFAPGDILDGKYEVLKILGIGGMGQVYKARHIHFNAIRSIKVIRADLSGNESFRSRFLDEARKSVLIMHPNVAIVFDFATLPDGSYYMVSEFIDGVTLRQWLQNHGRLPATLAVNVACQVLDGLGVIHRAGLVHRDISPENIMIAAGSEHEIVAKIIDLGIAKSVDGGGEGTTVGLFVGNPRYSSPEQLGRIGEGETIDARSDLYSLGVVLYEMLSGDAPFIAMTPQQYAAKHLTEAPPDLRASGLEIPPALSSVVMKALEKDRTHRFSSTRDFHDALSPFGQGASETALHKIRDLTRPASKTPAAGAPRPAAVVPPTYVPTPDASLARERNAEDEAMKKVDLLAARMDTAELRVMAGAHPRESVIGRAVASALARVSERLSEVRQSELQCWEAASSQRSPGALGEFLEKYPDGDHAEEARARFQELTEWEAAVKSGSVALFEGFLRRWPDSDRRADVERSLARLLSRERVAFDAAIAEGTVGALRGFLQLYPDSRHAQDAARFLQEKEDFDAALAGGNSALWARHLEDWSDGRFAEQARERLVAAEKRERAELARLAAAEDQEGLERFVLAAKGSRIEAEAAGVLEELRAFMKAATEDGPDSLAQYLDRYPAGHYVNEAREKLRAIEEAEFRRLEQTRDREAAARHLRKFPIGTRTGEVARLIRKWDEEDSFRTREVRVPEEASQTGEQSAILEGSAPREEADSRAEAERKPAEDVRRKEETLWANAWEQPSARSWRNYLAAFPEGVRSQEARQRLAESEAFEAAVRKDTRAAYERFIAEWPSGRHFREAEAALARRRQVDPGVTSSATAAGIPIVESAMAVPAAVAGPRSSRARRVLLLVVLMLVVAAIGVFLSTREQKVAPLPGRLVIDAQPWGEIRAIRDGRGVDHLAEAASHYTPLLVALPPGTYRIELASPSNTNGSRTVEVALPAGATRKVSVEFQKIDPAEYFRSAGWQ